jgi:hypothetical protein
MLGDRITLLVSGKEIGGAFTVLSETLTPGRVTFHCIRITRKRSVVCLNREYKIQCGDQAVRAGLGFLPLEKYRTS